MIPLKEIATEVGSEVVEWWSTPTGFIGARRPQELLNVRLDQAESNISVKFLSPLIQHEAWAAFDSHLFRVLIVRSQAGECSTIVNVFLDSNDIDANIFGYFTLNIPACNVPTISKKRTAKFPKY